MSKYIDVEKLKNKVEDMFSLRVVDNFGNITYKAVYALDKEQILAIIDDIEAEDAIHIIRCKDCRYCMYLKEIDVYSCRYFNTHQVKLNDFCSYGEKESRKMTDKQKKLIEVMNEFCREKCPLDATKEEASKYISRNMNEYTLEMESQGKFFGY